MRRKMAACLVLCSLVLSSCCASPADRLKQNMTALGEQTLALGLKRALGVGVREVVNGLGQAGGYLDNPLLRLVVPPPIMLAADLLRMGGALAQTDPIEAGMNRAAERAVPLAGPILLAALEQTSLPTMRGLLNAGETAATDYLRERTEGMLTEAFKPVVAATLAENGALARHQEVMGQAAEEDLFPEEGDKAAAVQPVALEEYTTTKAIAGLFQALEESEKRIRLGPEFKDLGLASLF